VNLTIRGPKYDYAVSGTYKEFIEPIEVGWEKYVPGPRRIEGKGRISLEQWFAIRNDQALMLEIGGTWHPIVLTFSELIDGESEVRIQFQGVS